MVEQYIESISWACRESYHRRTHWLILYKVILTFPASASSSDGSPKSMVANSSQYAEKTYPGQNRGLRIISVGRG